MFHTEVALQMPNENRTGRSGKTYVCCGKSSFNATYFYWLIWDRFRERTT